MRRSRSLGSPQSVHENAQRYATETIAERAADVLHHANQGSCRRAADHYAAMNRALGMADAHRASSGGRAQLITHKVIAAESAFLKRCLR